MREFTQLALKHLSGGDDGECAPALSRTHTLPSSVSLTHPSSSLTGGDASHVRSAQVTNALKLLKRLEATAPSLSVWAWVIQDHDVSE